MAASRKTSSGNRLLDSIPLRDRQRLVRQCEEVELVPGDLLYKLGEPLDHACFPIDGFVALLSPVDANLMQVGMVGNEGMVGASLALGVDQLMMHAVVLGGGSAWRIGAGTLTAELERSPGLRRRLNRYLCVMIGQLAQNAGCARYHLVEARLARWLLMARDRAHGDSFFITHELLADMLGVRRVGVTQAAGTLQKQQLITYRRGNVDILDARGLETAACDCYQEGKRMYEDMLA
ncbi:MAG: Crp/Fnr family transcriptional regulator [Gammaproteobacteria bacterium]|nr:Crp/Fnr family transcriptional regulator [Gammaproteobacteria bacterium]